MTDTQLALDGFPAALDWVGVTTVSKILNPGPGLMNWANKQGLAGKTLKQSFGGNTKRGLEVHRAHEALVKGTDIGVPSREARPFVKSLVAWWRETQPNVCYTEVNLSCERLMVRGRVDGVRLCGDPDCVCYGEGAVVYDFKSGSDRIYDEAHLQGDGYRELWHAGSLRPRHLCGVEFIALPEDGPARVVPCKAAPGDFLAALDLWRRMQRLR
jgi:hypothetical protein